MDTPQHEGPSLTRNRSGGRIVAKPMDSHPKRIGFLSFGAWHPTSGMTNSPADAVRQTLELAVAAEEIGIDGAFVRVHHWARQLSAPFPLLAAIGARTSRIEIGTAVIDMRYENPLYMAEDAAVADLLAGGRLQLGISRGSPESAWHGAEAFGYAVDADDVREKTTIFRAAISGRGSCVRTRAAVPATSCSPCSRSPPASLRGSGGAQVPASPRRGSASKGCT